MIREGKQTYIHIYITKNKKTKPGKTTRKTHLVLHSYWSFLCPVGMHETSCRIGPNGILESTLPTSTTAKRFILLLGGYHQHCTSTLNQLLNDTYFGGYMQKVQLLLSWKNKKFHFN